MTTDENIILGVTASDFKNLAIDGEGNIVEVGEGCSLRGLRLTIRGNNNVVKIGRKCAMKGILFINGHSNTFDVGDSSTVVEARFSIGGRKTVKIGKDCMLSRKIEVRTWDEHPIFDIDTKEQINFGKDVIIGNHVWVGVGVEIGKGSVIPDGCVIGANSIVTKKLGSKNSIYVGAPLKLYRSNIVWGRNHKTVPWARLNDDNELDYYNLE